MAPGWEPHSHIFLPRCEHRIRQMEGAPFYRRLPRTCGRYPGTYLSRRPCLPGCFACQRRTISAIRTLSTYFYAITSPQSEVWQWPPTRRPRVAGCL